MTVNKMIISFEEAMILRHLVEREIKERGEIKELVDLLNKINDMIVDEVFTLVDGSDKE